MNYIKRTWNAYPWYMKVIVSIQLAYVIIFGLYMCAMGWYDILFGR